jgi:hypothetical protein
MSVMLCAMALLGFAAEAAFAHHSFASFDMKKEAWIEGTVSEVQYTNPHAWIFIDVVTGEGGTETYAVEAGSISLLMRAGWKKNTLVVGNKVKVLMHPMRDPSKKGGALVSVVLPDGKTLSGG